MAKQSIRNLSFQKDSLNCNYPLDLMSKLGKAAELGVPLPRGCRGGQLSPQAQVVCSNHV